MVVLPILNFPVEVSPFQGSVVGVDLDPRPPLRYNLGYPNARPPALVLSVLSAPCIKLNFSFPHMPFQG